ncbi:MAG: hypothetical protein GY803_12590, partial [Chloroflexi bacterium]|nr:hypothetical protein [Chloroflexota bacterium]
QANYVVRLYTRAWAEGLDGAVWYTLYGEGWRDSDLMTRGKPRLAYQALQFLAGELAGATLMDDISADGYEGYRFCRGNVEYRLYWTNEALTLPLPEQPGVWHTAYDKLGARVQADAISFEPLLVKNWLLGRCERIEDERLQIEE